MGNPASDLMIDLERRGWRGRLVPLHHLEDLERAIVGRHEGGAFDETFFQERLAFFSFARPAEMPAARSMIVVAIPVPEVRMVFHWRRTAITAVLPPTYLGYARTTECLRQALGEWLAPHGFRVAATRLPLKTLAVSCGLGEYGRNNIVYVEGMGSYLQLAAVYSDLPPQDDPWREPRMMARCETCRACLNRCPTGAIGEDRFLLRAERCITFHNERKGAFPSWLGPAWHNCLLGCMHCQWPCPENKMSLSRVEFREEFSEEETRSILSGGSLGDLEAPTSARLQGLDLTEDLENLPRNLLALIEAAEHGARPPQVPH